MDGKWDGTVWYVEDIIDDWLENIELFWSKVQVTGKPVSPVSGDGESIWRSIPDNPPNVSLPSLKSTKPKDNAAANSTVRYT